MTTILRDEAGELAEKIHRLGLGSKTKAEELAKRMRAPGAAGAALLAEVRRDIEEIERLHSRNIPSVAGRPYKRALRRQAASINEAADLANRADDLIARQRHLQTRLDRAMERKDRSQRALQNLQDRIKSLDAIANPKNAGFMNWRHFAGKAVAGPLLSTARAQLTWREYLQSRVDGQVDGLDSEFQAAELEARQGDEAVTNIKAGVQKSNDAARAAWVAIQGAIDMPRLARALPGSVPRRLHSLIDQARLGQPTDFQQLATMLSIDVPLLAFSFQLKENTFWWAKNEARDTRQKRRILQEQLREIVRTAESMRLHNNSGIAALTLDTAKRLASEKVKALLDENTSRFTEVEAAQEMYHSPDWHRDIETEPGILTLRHMGRGWAAGPPHGGFSGEEIRIPYKINESGRTVYTLPDGRTTQDIASAIIETQRSTRRSQLETLITATTAVGGTPVLNIHTLVDRLRGGDPRYAQYTFTTTLLQTSATPPKTTGIRVAWAHTPLPIGGYTPPATNGSFDIPLENIPTHYVRTTLEVDGTALKTEIDRHMQSTLDAHNHTNRIHTGLRGAIESELGRAIAPATIPPARSPDFSGSITVRDKRVTVDYTHKLLGESVHLELPTSTFTVDSTGTFIPAKIQSSMSSLVDKMKRIHERQAYINSHSTVIVTDLERGISSALADYGIRQSIHYVPRDPLATPIVNAHYLLSMSEFAGVSMVENYILPQELLDVTYDSATGVGTAHDVKRLTAEAKKHLLELDKVFKSIPAVLKKSLLSRPAPAIPVSIGHASCSLDVLRKKYLLRVQDMQGETFEYFLDNSNIAITKTPRDPWRIDLTTGTIITDLCKKADATSTAPTTATSVESTLNTSSVPSSVTLCDELNATEGTCIFVKPTAKKEAHYLWQIDSYHAIPVSSFALEIPLSALADPNNTSDILDAMGAAPLFKTLQKTLLEIETHDLLYSALEEASLKNTVRETKWAARNLKPDDIAYDFFAYTVTISGKTYSLKDFIHLSFKTKGRAKSTTPEVEFGSLINKIYNAF